jgi:hypothetical protein
MGSLAEWQDFFRSEAKPPYGFWDRASAALIAVHGDGTCQSASARFSPSAVLQQSTPFLTLNSHDPTLAQLEIKRWVMSKIMIALRNAMLGSTATLLALEWAGTASLTREIGMAFTLTILLTVYTSFDRPRRETSR